MLYTECSFNNTINALKPELLLGTLFSSPSLLFLLHLQHTKLSKQRQYLNLQYPTTALARRTIESISNSIVAEFIIRTYMETTLSGIIYNALFACLHQNRDGFLLVCFELSLQVKCRFLLFSLTDAF